MIPLRVYPRISPVIITPADYDLENTRQVKHGIQTLTVASYVHFDNSYDRMGSGIILRHLI